MLGLVFSYFPAMPNNTSSSVKSGQKVSENNNFIYFSKVWL